MKLLLYSLWGLLWQQMNAAGNLITFLSAPVPFRRQCKSQQHFLLILQVAQKMSNSPPEGLMRAFHLSLKILFRYLEGSLLFFSQNFWLHERSPHSAHSITPLELNAAFHFSTFLHTCPPHQKTRFVHPEVSLYIPFLLLCLSWVFLETSTHLAALMEKALRDGVEKIPFFLWSWAVQLGEGSNFFIDKVLTYRTEGS